MSLRTIFPSESVGTMALSFLYQQLQTIENTPPGNLRLQTLLSSLEAAQLLIADDCLSRYLVEKQLVRAATTAGLSHYEAATIVKVGIDIMLGLELSCPEGNVTISH